MIIFSFQQKRQKNIGKTMWVGVWVWLAHVGGSATPIYATPTPNSTSLVANRSHCTTQNIAEGLFLCWIQVIDTCFKHLAVSLKKIVKNKNKES